MIMGNDFILYTDPNGKIKLNVRIEGETIWLTQKMMAELFGVAVSTINEHLGNIYIQKELTKEATIRNFRIVQIEGKREVAREIDFYNLDAIISVGYRVNSFHATQFRIWATSVLKEYIVKGFAMNDERLKQGDKMFEKDYFRELLERVRSIRASERRIYQQITDIFAECTIDYNPRSEITKNFYAFIQNKFHYAICQHTAAELVFFRADKALPNMGLTTWKNSPSGRILSSDVTIAKNYLSEKDIRRLERTVTSFFDYIENLIEQETVISMENMVENVDNFLKFNRLDILQNRGKISKFQAEEKALAEYAEFNKTQKISSDFDKEIGLFLAGKEIRNK